MAYYSLPTGRFHKKTKSKRLSKIPANYESRFYKTLDDPFNKPFDTYFQRDIVSKKPPIGKSIFSQQVILEKVCRMILICTSPEIG